MVTNATARIIPLNLIRGETALELRQDVGTALHLLDNPVRTVPFMSEGLTPLNLQRPAVR